PPATACDWWAVPTLQEPKIRGSVAIVSSENTPVPRRRSTPAELVAQRAVEAVARQADHRERRLAPAHDHAVAAGQGDLHLAVDDEDGRDARRQRDHLVDLMRGVD